MTKYTHYHTQYGRQTGNEDLRLLTVMNDKELGIVKITPGPDDDRLPEFWRDAINVAMRRDGWTMLWASQPNALVCIATNGDDSFDRMLFAVWTAVKTVEATPLPPIRVDVFPPIEEIDESTAHVTICVDPSEIQLSRTWYVQTPAGITLDRTRTDGIFSAERNTVTASMEDLRDAVNALVEALQSSH